MKALLQLDGYWVEDLRVKAAPGIVERHAWPVILPRIQCEVFRAPEDAVYRVDLRLVAGPSAVARGLPYEYRLQMYGIFSFESGTADDTQERLVHVSGPAMLYGIARGVLAQSTALGPHGRYLLPSINFVNLLERAQRG